MAALYESQGTFLGQKGAVASPLDEPDQIAFAGAQLVEEDDGLVVAAIGSGQAPAAVGADDQEPARRQVGHAAVERDLSDDPCDTHVCLVASNFRA